MGGGGARRTDASQYCARLAFNSSTAWTASTTARDGCPGAPLESRRTLWMTDFPAMRSHTQISAVLSVGARTIANVPIGSSSRPTVSSAVRTSRAGGGATMLTANPAAVSSPCTRASASDVTSSVTAGRSSTTR